MPDALDTDRCVDCDAPLATKADEAASIRHQHDGGCECAACCSVCWRAWHGDVCQRKPVDWRARASRMEAALRRIACFDEGPEVTGAFDEPGAATIAREALALPAADRRAENDKHE